MTRYLISFDEGDMRFPAEELQAVSAAAHTVVAEAKAAGVWVWGGGVLDSDEANMVAADAGVSGPRPGKTQYLGGFSILEVASREEAFEWAAKIAAACRCAQEVREIMYDPES
jgi:hypothetical protein